MKQCNVSTKEMDVIHLAFDPNTLESLIRTGKLHASDFNCLDSSSKQGVWSVLRSVAAGKIQLL
ncbi:MAG: hypothetical protein HRU40_22375 [Saprospiraceae bacterium]|nr:hypothetical protein [Saprospiraceae bacterium]